MSRLPRILSMLVAATALYPATLQQLSMDQMSHAATAIVRARVTAESASLIGSTVYTHYKLAVSETWKGRTPDEVLVPGGRAAGIDQVFPGASVLETGKEYVLFLWTSPAGLTQVLGLTQGLFNVSGTLAVRPESGEMMLDAKGKPVSGRAIRTSVAALKAQVGK